MTKEDLLDAFFKVGSNVELKRTDKIQEDLERYVYVNGYDRQIDDVLILYKMFKHEARFSDFEEACKIAEPIIERVYNSNEELDFYDIRILTMAVGHTKSYIQSCFIAEKLLKNLKKYIEHERYPYIELAIHMNVITKLVRAKYNDNIDKNDYKKLEGEFFKYTDTARLLCKREKLLDIQGMILVKRGIFFEDMNLIKNGLKLIEDNGTRTMYDIMLRDVNEYKAHIRFPLTVKEFNLLIAKNIKKYREDKSISLKTLSNSIGISYLYLSKVEKGLSPISIYNLFRLSEILAIPVTEFIKDKDADTEENKDTNKDTNKKINKKLSLIEENRLRLNEVNTALVALDSEELSVIISIIKKLVKLRNFD